MPDKDNGLKKEWQEMYDLAAGSWGDWLEEADADFKAYLGDQWNAGEKNWLTQQKRAHYVFNRIRRTVKLLTGYQRKTRLSMKIMPVGKEDQEVADAMSNILMHTMTKADGYNVMSDAYESGPIITGMNFVEVYTDNRGTLRLARQAYNKMLPDPTMTKRDLSDCDFILRREMLSKGQIKMLLRGMKDRDIDNLPDARTDNKFPYLPWGFRKYGEKLVNYDEYWKQETKRVKMLLHLQTGERMEWPGTDRELREYLAYNPMLDSIDQWVDKITLHILVGGEYMMTVEDPMRLGMYPFIGLFGFWHPEVDDDKLKLQGVVRSLRDPQSSYNRRISQMIDIIESQIASGWEANENSVVDPEDLYQTGQGQVIWKKENAPPDALKKIPPPDIPQGLFALNQMLDNLMVEIPGINEELFGTEEKQIPGVLSKLRQGAALTTLQDLWDNYRQSKRLLGRVLIKAVQQQYEADKVTRMTSKPVPPAFYERDLSDYDIMVQEGLLTDNQRQMYYEELKQMYQMTAGPQGSPIPVSSLLEAAPIQMKEELKKAVDEGQRQQQQAQQKQQEQEETLKQWQQAQIANNIAKSKERMTQADENRTSAAYDRARTAAEIQKMGDDQILDRVKLIIEAAKALEPPKPAEPAKPKATAGAKK
jgi:hypothetical protein